MYNPTLTPTSVLVGDAAIDQKQLAALAAAARGLALACMALRPSLARRALAARVMVALANPVTGAFAAHAASTAMTTCTTFPARDRCATASAFALDVGDVCGVVELEVDVAPIPSITRLARIGAILTWLPVLPRIAADAAAAAVRPGVAAIVAPALAISTSVAVRAALARAALAAVGVQHKRSNNLLGEDGDVAAALPICARGRGAPAGRTAVVCAGGSRRADARVRVEDEVGAVGNKVLPRVRQVACDFTVVPRHKVGVVDSPLAKAADWAGIDAWQAAHQSNGGRGNCKQHRS